MSGKAAGRGRGRGEHGLPMNLWGRGQPVHRHNREGVEVMALEEVVIGAEAEAEANVVGLVVDKEHRRRMSFSNSATLSDQLYYATNRAICNSRWAATCVGPVLFRSLFSRNSQLFPIERESIFRLRVFSYQYLILRGTQNAAPPTSLAQGYRHLT
jgi:hypothetical protein